MLFFRERHGEGRAFARLALNAHVRLLDERSVLHDGEAQPRAAGGLGVALIHPVEPLKDPVRLPGGDADAGVLHGEDHKAVLLGDRDLHGPAVLIVLDGVVAEVEDRLGQQTADARDRNGLAGDSHSDLALLRGALQRLDRVGAEGEQLHRLGGQAAALVQLRQAEDVVLPTTSDSSAVLWKRLATRMFRLSPST